MKRWTFFQGYSSSQNTWEPKSNFGSEEMINEYHNSLKKKFGTKNSVKKEAINVKQEIQDDDATSSKTKSNKRTYLLPGDLLTAAEIEENQWVPKKVVNIYHMMKNENDLVALMQFKNQNSLHFVKASWANEHCPQLVIKFYETRISWREKQ